MHAKISCFTVICHCC